VGLWCDVDGNKMKVKRGGSFLQGYNKKKQNKSMWLDSMNLDRVGGKLWLNNILNVLKQDKEHTLKMHHHTLLSIQTSCQ
jgi:hypothetical protein